MSDEHMTDEEFREKVRCCATELEAPWGLSVHDDVFIVTCSMCGLHATLNVWGANWTVEVESKPKCWEGQE